MNSSLGNNFGYLCSILFGIILTATHVHSNILCSRCDSRKDNFYGECEQSPPSPTPCPIDSDAMYCSIVRETDFDGIQLLFARDCATSYLEEKCIVQNHTTHRLKTVCFRTCDMSGCNSERLKGRGAASQLQVHLFTSLLTATVIVVVYFCRGQVAIA